MNTQIERNWNDLAHAIIVQAASDYRRAQYRNMKRPHQLDTLREIRSLELFFRSPWFTSLSNLDGKQILLDLKKTMRLEGKS